MNCRDIEKLLYLNRPGELSAKEQKKLKNHLSKCTDCASLKINIEKYNTVYASLQNSKPVINEPEMLSTRIMNNIKPEQVSNKQSEKFIEIFASWFYKPIIKYSFMVVLLLMLSSLFVQQIKITNSISKLESQATNYSPAKRTKLSGLFTKIKQTDFRNADRSLHNKSILLTIRKNINNLGRNNKIAFYTAIKTIPELKNLSSPSKIKKKNSLIFLKRKTRYYYK